MIASMGSVAASGGYYMAMACDEIVAQETTLTGSIGVVSMRINFEELYKNFLINVDVVKTSPSADFFDDYRPLTESEVQGFHERVAAGYQSFVAKAAQSRKMAYDELEQVARGRVWTGKDALGAKLVDHNGGLATAVERAAQKAGLSSYQLIRYPQEESYWDWLRNSKTASTASGQWSALKDLLPAELRLLVDVTQHRDGPGLMALSPYFVQID